MKSNKSYRIGLIPELCHFLLERCIGQKETIINLNKDDVCICDLADFLSHLWKLEIILTGKILEMICPKAQCTRQIFVFERWRFLLLLQTFYSTYDICLFSKFQLGKWHEALRSFDTNGLAHWLISIGNSVFEMLLGCRIRTRRISTQKSCGNYDIFSHFKELNQCSNLQT